MAGAAPRRPLGGWQRENVLAAAQYMVRRLRDAPGDLHVRVICEGLLDVLDPARIGVRHERALTAAAKAAALPEARKGLEPRSGRDRRTAPAKALASAERRERERRARHDRRKK